MTGLTLQQEQGLMIARLLVKAGMPVFLAAADPTSPQGFRLPMGWQNVECDPEIVDAWRPGDALCAVTGRTFDLVDIDPRSGGTEEAIPMPHSYLAAETPSGGRHHFVSALGVASRDGVAPGVDVKSGTLEGTGRGFAFIAPTVRASKVDGIPREYRWYTGPDGPGLPSADQRAADGSGARLRARVMELRRTQPQTAEPRRVPLSVARREFDRAARGLADDVRRWKVMGWGGEAHSGLLAATTHLARLDHANAEAAFRWAFAAAGVLPDEGDLTKLHSAIERAVPDIVIPDEQLSEQERFFLGGDSPLGAVPGLGEGSGVDAEGKPVEALPYGVQVELQRLRDRTQAREIFEAERSGRTSDFELISFDELQMLAPPSPLIAGLLDRGTYAVMPGQFASFKTFTALSWAFSLALGKSWGEYAVPSAEPVIFIAAEGVAGIAKRLAALSRHYGVPVPSTLHVVPRVVDLGSDAAAARLGGFVADTGAKLVVSDTLHRCTPGLDENSNADMGAVLGRMNKHVIEPTGATWLALHHPGHESERSRGASCIEDDADTVLFSRIVGGGTDRSLNRLREIEVRKTKDGNSGRRIPLRVTPVLESLVVESATAHDTGLSFFAESADTRISAIVEMLRLHEADGASWKFNVDTTVRMLRNELGVNGDDKTILRPAARRFLATTKGFSQMGETA